MYLCTQKGLGQLNLRIHPKKCIIPHTPAISLLCYLMRAIAYAYASTRTTSVYNNYCLGHCNEENEKDKKHHME